MAPSTWFLPSDPWDVLLHTVRSTVQAGFASHTAPPSLGDASTDLNGCFPSRTTDTRYLSFVTSVITMRESQTSASPRLNPAWSASEPSLPDTRRSAALKRLHVLIAAGHMVEPATRDSSRARAGPVGTGCSCASLAVSSDSAGLGSSSLGRELSSGGASWTTISRLSAWATRAYKAYRRKRENGFIFAHPNCHSLEVAYGHYVIGDVRFPGCRTYGASVREESRENDERYRTNHRRAAA